MTDLAVTATTARVQQYLVNLGYPRHTLRVVTQPHAAGRVTTVRPSAHGNGWTQPYAENLAEVLRGLPGARVTLRPVVDRIDVVWDDT